MNMKKVIPLILTAAVAMNVGAAESKASETAWPNGETIQMIIPFSAGGDTDLHCRVLTELVAEELGVDIVCTNVTGSSGTIAARQVMDSANDGNTILWHQTSFLMASLTGVSEFDYHDFTTACTVIEDATNFLCVNPNNEKFSDLDSFIEYAKENPGDLLVGAGIGGDGHLYSLIMEDAMGVEFTYVDLDGSNEIIPAMLNQDVDVEIGLYSGRKEYLENGDLEMLLYFGNESLEGYEDVPLWKDVMESEFPLAKMFGYWFPAETPQEIVDTFNAAVEKAVNSDTWKEHCEAYYLDSPFRTCDDAVEYLDAQYAVMEQFREALLGE